MAQKKKDFSGINTSPVYATISEATTPAEDLKAPMLEEPAAGKTRKDRKTYTDQEKIDMMLVMQTSGRKGVKLPRINLAFSPDNYEFIKTMAQVRGQSMTDFVNDVLRKCKEENMEIYAKAIEFRNSL